MKTIPLTKELHYDLILMTYTHLIKVGEKDAEPGNGTIIIYKPVIYEPEVEIDSAAVLITDDQIVTMVNEDIDFVSIHITEDY